jgi:hypothetical protein
VIDNEKREIINKFGTGPAAVVNFLPVRDTEKFGKHLTNIHVDIFGNEV